MKARIAAVMISLFVIAVAVLAHGDKDKSWRSAKY